MKLWRKPLGYNAQPIATHRISIDKERCKGCGYCNDLCPRDALVIGTDLNQKGYRVASVSDEGKCLACGFCEVICPEFAIEIHADDYTNKQLVSKTTQ